MKLSALIKHRVLGRLPMPAKRFLKAAYRFGRNDVLYGTLLYHYGIARHRRLLKNVDRSQSHTYTCFYRSPGQMDALVGPVMQTLRPTIGTAPLQINVFAGSTGAESYTLASVLSASFPNLAFHIATSDLHQELVDYAARAIYTEDEVRQGGVPDQFIRTTFDFLDGRYHVKPELNRRVSFTRASLLSPDLCEQFPLADIVFAQNVFFHLDPESARRAFMNVVALLKPKSALFIDGMALDMREELTQAQRLIPLEYKYGEIYEEARTHLSPRWWNYYYGTAPYVGLHSKSIRRYSTIFFKGVSPNA